MQVIHQPAEICQILMYPLGKSYSCLLCGGGIPKYYWTILRIQRGWLQESIACPRPGATYQHQSDFECEVWRRGPIWSGLTIVGAGKESCWWCLPPTPGEPGRWNSWSTLPLASVGTRRPFVSTFIWSLGVVTPCPVCGTRFDRCGAAYGRAPGIVPKLHLQRCSRRLLSSRCCIWGMGSGSTLTGLYRGCVSWVWLIHLYVFPVCACGASGCSTWLHFWGPRLSLYLCII